LHRAVPERLGWRYCSHNGTLSPGDVALLTTQETWVERLWVPSSKELK
jgi:hypothetical protein